MDPQRDDGQRWYDDEPYGEPSNRYGSLNEDRYSQPERFNPYGEEQHDERTEQPPYSGGDRRSHPRRGKRSGLAMPDAPAYGDDTQYETPQPQYDSSYGDFPDAVADEPVRLSARDRQQLRERAQSGGHPLASALTSGPVATPMVPLGSPISESPMSRPMSPPAALHAPTEAIPAGVRQVPTATYRSRRPGLAVLLTLGGVIAELILFKVLLGNAFHSGAGAVSGTLGALFALAGVPMLVIGLYALATGAATASGPQPGRAWLRTPLAYLPIGLLLIVAAGLAA